MQKQKADGERGQAVRRKTRQCNDGFYARFAHWSSHANPAHQPIHWHRERWILFGTALLLTLLSGVLLPVWAHALGTSTEVAPRHVTSLPVPPLPPAVHQAAKPSEVWHSVTVEPGQTLSEIFHEQGLGFSDLQRVLDASKHADALRQIQPGDTFAFLLGADGAFKGLRFDSDAAHRVVMRVDGAHLVSSVEPRDIETRRHVAHGVVDSSLFDAGAAAGLSETMIFKLADVFKYDIDFSREIRTGDSFTVIYNSVYRDGSYLRAGQILAAEFVNRGHRYTAYRFTLPNGQTGYYSEDGRPLQKALLRTPIKFSRISSRFGMRVDPVTHKKQLHAGVDLAAPTGTPIHAAGNGVITVRSWVRGYGRYVRIKDTPAYSTYYGHMSRYKRGLHVGSHVHQGQVIGYVGESGWATGPHLHYGVLLHGRPVNPLKVTLPKPKPLAPKLLARFNQHIRPALARINSMKHRFAMARDEHHQGTR